MFHIHKFKEIERNALGVWEKQEGQNNLVTVRGIVKECQCGELRITPHDKKLRTVEVTR